MQNYNNSMESRSVSNVDTICTVQYYMYSTCIDYIIFIFIYG